MRRYLRKHIPSMFARRLTLLMGAVTVLTVCLGLATARLSLGSQQQRRQLEAEKVLRRTERIPTVRGRIFDRHQRVLAEDESTFDVVVAYPVIAGDWAYDLASQVTKATYRNLWPGMSAEDRHSLITAQQKVFEQQADTLWDVLAEVGQTNHKTIEDRKNKIVRGVHRISARHTQHRQRRLQEQRGESVPWAEAFEEVREQHQSHAILHNIGTQARRIIERFIAEAELEQRRYAHNRRLDRNAPDERTSHVWGQVALERPDRRNYPFETMTLMVPTNHLPSPLTIDQYHGQDQEIMVAGVGLHTIGRMRRVWREDLQARPFRPGGDLGGYLAHDRKGLFGIEGVMESQLRGTRGWRIKQLDTGQAQQQSAVPGHDVVLTIDIKLQAHIQAIMSPGFGLMKRQWWHFKPDQPRLDLGQPLNGATIVLEIATGQVLAAVSMPPITLRQLRENPSSVYTNQYDSPFRNRAIAQPYQPGSTIKPLVLVAAYTDGLLGLDQVIDTPGYLWPDKPTVYRDWLYKQKGLAFGQIDGVTAIMRSSNVFFGLLAQRLGSDRLNWWFEQYGLGCTTGSGLPGEHRGELPSSSDGSHSQWGWEFMAIGQGPIRWTPLQAANAYASLVRGGRHIQPTFVRRDDAPVVRDLNLNRSGLDRAFRGMYGSANELQGTTHRLSQLDGEAIFNTEGVLIRAKSGTAQAVSLREAIDDNGDGLPDRWGRELRSGDHAWVIALVQPDGTEKPTYVIATVVEYGGSGGQVAGPVVNQVIHALQREGYL